MLCEIIPLPMSRVAWVEDKREKTTEMRCCQNLNSFEKKTNGLLIINNNCHSAFTHRISKTLRKKTLQQNCFARDINYDNFCTENGMAVEIMTL